jgi:hypothetical protein
MYTCVGKFAHKLVLLRYFTVVQLGLRHNLQTHVNMLSQQLQFQVLLQLPNKYSSCPLHLPVVATAAGTICSSVDQPPHCVHGTSHLPATQADPHVNLRPSPNLGLGALDKTRTPSLTFCDPAYAWGS